MKSHSTTVNQIGKLLALAMDQAGKPEGIAAQRKADELMDRHSVNMKDVGHGEDSMEERTVDTPAAQWRRSLLTVLAQYTETSYLTFRGGRKAKFFGKSWRIEMAIFLNDTLVHQLEDSLKVWASEQPFPPPRSYRTQFRESFVMSIAERLHEMCAARRARSDEGHAGAMVSQREGQLAAQLLRERHGEPDTTKFRPDNHQAGADAGKSARIQTGIPGKIVPRLAD